MRHNLKIYHAVQYDTKKSMLLIQYKTLQRSRSLKRPPLNINQAELLKHVTLSSTRVS